MCLFRCTLFLVYLTVLSVAEKICNVECSQRCSRIFQATDLLRTFHEVETAVTRLLTRSTD
jgi:hypothetical protein